jgi:hypothetical protein
MITLCRTISDPIYLRQTITTMKKKFRFYSFSLFFILGTIVLHAQPVSGNKTIGTDYLTLAAAIADLNVNGVGTSGATVVVPSGYTETAPSGGFMLGSAVLNASLSATSPLVIMKGGTGTNPLITAFSPGISTTIDGIFKIAGADYVTMNGIDLNENVLNTTATQQMEWGYALVKRQSTAPFDGCQYVTIKNCVITLNRTNIASVGIYAGNHIATANTALTITAITDANSHNRFTGNTISNVFTGVSLNGYNHTAAPYSLYDQNNKVGGDSITAGNTITNYAGSGNVLTAGVYMIYQNNDSVQYNTIENAGGGGIAHGVSIGTNSVLYGICHSTASTSNIVVRNNRIKLTKAAGPGEVHAIFSSATGNITVDNNTLKAVTTGTMTARMSMINLSGNASAEKIRNNIFDSIAVVSTGDMMLVWYSNTTPNIEVTGNTINTLVSKTGGNGLFYGLLCDATASGGTAIVQNNNFSNITLAAGANAYIIYHAPRGLQTAIIRNNIVSAITCTGITTLYGIHFNGGEGSIIDSNTVANITGAGGMYGIYTPTGITATYAIRNNQVRTLNTSSFPVYGVQIASGNYEFAYNKISDIQSTSASGFVFGGLLGGTIVNTHHNLIGNIRAPQISNATGVNGLSLSGTATTVHSMYYNTIYLNASGTGASFGSVGLTVSSDAALNLRNNIIINKSAANGTGLTVAYKRSNAGLAKYDSRSGNNIFYAGVPSAANLIFSDGTGSDSLFGDYKTRVTPADGNSYTENVRFIDSTGSTPYFLWPDSTVATVAESGARNISGYTIDFKGKVLQGNPGYTGTGTNPDIGAIEAELTPVPMSYDSTVVSQITSALPVNTTKQAVLKIRINLSGAYNPLTLTALYFRTSGTTDVNDIDSARVFVTGTGAVFNTDEQYGTAIKNPNGSFTIIGNKALSAGVNYLWLTYNIRAGAILNHTVDGGLDSMVLSGLKYIPVNGNPAGSRTIKGPFTGEYFVGAGKSYTTITNMITDLGILGVSGPVILTLTDNSYTSATETFPVVINEIAGASAVNTITMRPDSAVSVSIIDSVNTSLLVLNGTDYFTIDGRQRATLLSRKIRIVNNHISAGAAALTFINDASRNHITYTVLKGANAPTDGVGAVVYFGTGMITGNDYNLIDSCEIGNASGVPSTLILSAGSTDNGAIQNSNNTVNSCYLYNFWNSANESNGLKLSNGTTDWIITNNHFYQEMDLFGTGSAKQQYALNLNKGGNANALNNMIITDNYIGGSAPFCGGSTAWSLSLATNKRLTAMHLDLGTATGSVVKRNTFNNFFWNTSNNSTGGPGIWCAVSYAGGLCDIDSNTIGSMSGAASLTVNSSANATVYGIYISSSTPGIFSVTGNKMGNITVGTSGTTVVNFTGIGIASGAATATLNIKNNIIGNTLNDNIKISASASSTAQVSSGINNSGAYVLNITDNTIRNLSNAYTGTGAGQTAGILSTAGSNQVIHNLIYNLSIASPQTGTNATSSVTGISVSSSVAGTTVAQNTVYGLNNTHATAAVHVTGINYAGATNGMVNRNFVHTLSVASSSATAQQNGIIINGGTVRVTNNMVRLGIDSTGLSQPLATVMIGINKNGGNMAALYNSVSIQGQVTGTGLARTSSFSRTVTGIDSVMNNIFANERSNTGTGGGHYAISLNNTSTITCNNNLYWVSGSGDSVGYLNNARALTLNAWRTLSSVDGASGFGYPGFVNASGNSADVNLHMASFTPAEGLGASISTVAEDFDGQLRSSFTPFDMGADAGNFTPSDIFPPVITFTPLSFTALATPRTLIATITDAVGLSLSSNRPFVYFKKSALGTYAMSMGSFVSGTPQNGRWSFVIDPSVVGSLSLGDTLFYFVAATDSSASMNMGSYPVGADGFAVSALIAYPATPSYYVLTAPLSGIINVGTGETYTSLTGTGGLFEAVNNSVLTGDLTVRIKSNVTETGLNALNMFQESGAGNYIIRIVPDAATERIISGSVAVADGMLRLNGASRIIIDGRFNGNGRYLKFANTNVNGPVISLTNDAKKDTIQYCTILGNCTATGNLVFGTSAVGGTGNDSNMVSRCVFSDTVSIPATHIYSAGTANAGQENSYNRITDNELSDFSQNGVYLTAAGNGDNWSFTGNALYETGVNSGILCGFRILSGNGHLIRRNSIGGSAADRSGTIMQTATGNVYGFYLSPGNGTATLVDSNSFGNISTVFNNNGCYGAYIQSGNVNLLNNMFGGMLNPWDSIRTTYENAVVLIDGGTVTVEGNTIGNLKYTGTTNAVRINGVTVTGGTTTIRNNIIRDIYSSAIGLLYTQTVAGIYMNASVGVHTIEGNHIYRIANTNSNTSPLPAVGIVINNTAVTTIIRNRIYDIYTSGTGTGTLAGIASAIYAGAGSNTYLHNQLSLGRYVNGENRVMGILDAGTGSNKYYYNTILINGYTQAGTNNSYCLFRNAGSVPELKNNILFNKRKTGGSGKGYTFGSVSVTGINNSTANYNLMVGDTATLVEMPSGTSIGLTAWNNVFTSAGTYQTNWSELADSIPAHLFFTDTVLADLSIQTTNAYSWYANGKGLPLSTVAGDFKLVASARSTNIGTGASDIGSVEFTPATLPPASKTLTAPAFNTQSTYTFAGRKIAIINWGSSGTLPAQPVIRYYSGVNAPNLIPGKAQQNAYVEISASGGAGFNYTVSVICDSAVYGAVGGASTMRMARYNTGWFLQPGSSASGVNGMLSSGSSLTAFGNFTGTDVSNPLPVDLIGLTAKRDGEDIHIEWLTAQEINIRQYEVERSYAGKLFNRVGSVEAIGNTTQLQRYQYQDLHPMQEQSHPVAYYRLKIIETDGAFSYSPVVKVVWASADLHEAVIVYPNPCDHEMNLIIRSVEESTAHVSVSDLTGRIVIRQEIGITRGENRLMLETDTLTEGVYFIAVKINNQNKVIRIMKR